MKTEAELKELAEKPRLFLVPAVNRGRVGVGKTHVFVYLRKGPLKTLRRSLEQEFPDAPIIVRRTGYFRAML